MSAQRYNVHDLDILFDEPRPLDMFIVDVLNALDISQQEFADAVGSTQAKVSKLVRRKTEYPTDATLEKIHHALINAYGASPKRATLYYLRECRRLLNP